MKEGYDKLVERAPDDQQAALRRRLALVDNFGTDFDHRASFTIEAAWDEAKSLCNFNRNILST